VTRLLKSAKTTEGDGWKYMPEGQPRTCSGCGEKVTLKQSLWFKTLPPLETWHTSCKAAA
jgi:hypothetical protein